MFVLCSHIAAGLVFWNYAVLIEVFVFFYRCIFYDEFNYLAIFFASGLISVGRFHCIIDSSLYWGFPICLKLGSNLISSRLAEGGKRERPQFK